MKTLIFCASAVALTMLAASPIPAVANSDIPKTSQNKCVWQSQPQFGPRALLRAPVCTKVGDQRVKFTGQGGPYCDPTGKPGHYEWRSPPQFGPRAPLPAPIRVWVEAC